MRHSFSTITLIGMAGAGKSTVGPILANLCDRQFTDTDDLIARHAGMGLQEYLNLVGTAEFQRLEEEILLAIPPNNQIIATGGSAIYSDPGMAHLRSIGTLILLVADLATLKRRVANMSSRGLINPGAGSFQDLYHARKPLYHKWADHQIPVEMNSPEEIAYKIIALLDTGG